MTRKRNRFQKQIFIRLSENLAVDQLDFVGLVQDFMDGHFLKEGFQLEGSATQARIPVETHHQPPGKLGADVGHLDLVANLGFLPVVQTLCHPQDTGEEPDVLAVVIPDQAEDQGTVEIVAAGPESVPGKPFRLVTEIDVERLLAAVVASEMKLALLHLFPGHPEDVFQLDFFPCHNRNPLMFTQILH